MASGDGTPYIAMVLGNQKTGKTCLIGRLFGEDKTGYYFPSFGVEFARITCENQTAILWDTSGQHDAITTYSQYINRANVVILTFSYEDETPIETQLQEWINLVKPFMAGCQFIVVGNKANTVSRSDDDAKIKGYLDSQLGEGNYQFVKADAKENRGIQKSDGMDDNPSLFDAINTCCKQLTNAQQQITSTAYFPNSYAGLSKQAIPKDLGDNAADPRSAALTQLRAQMLTLLKDYSGHGAIFGVFSKAVFFHPRRHHKNAVIDIIDNKLLLSAESFSETELLFTYNALAEIPKKPGGSLDRRVQYIKHLIAHSHELKHLSKELAAQAYNTSSEPIEYTLR